MEFIQLTDREDFRAEEIFRHYSETFPQEERRSERQFQQLFHNDLAKVYTILNGLQTVGYAIIWKLSNFAFLEHFEVFKEFRNQNLGSKILSSLYEKFGKIVLESEPPTLNETAKRRIDFYERNGFNLIDEDYVQPSYGDGKNPVPLWLLGNWKPENAGMIKEEIYDVVYRGL